MQRGLTLIELMVVIAILAILASFAVVGINSWVRDMKVQEDVRIIYSVLKSAQRRAFLEKVECCVSFNGSSVFMECDNSSNAVVYLKTSFVADKKVCYDKSGFTNDNVSVCYNGVSDAKYSCVSVDFIEIRFGKAKWEDGKCSCEHR